MAKEKRIGNARKKLWQEDDTNRKTNGAMKDCVYVTKANSVVFTIESDFAIGYCA